VGSLAVAILANLGYTVVASTGSIEAHDYLRSLGAQEILDREVLAAPSQRPLESGRWSGAVDTVGGQTLAGVLRTLAYGASVAACGNAGGNELHTTVLPFILRSVSLLGIDSNACPYARRVEAWARLAEELPKNALRRTMSVVGLHDVVDSAEQIVQGRIDGRVVVDVNT
jgi:acrylyl-CoA reductase (NADPH)